MSVSGIQRMIIMPTMKQFMITWVKYLMKYAIHVEEVKRFLRIWLSNKLNKRIFTWYLHRNSKLVALHILPTLKSGVWTHVQLLCSESGTIICIYNSFWILSFSDSVEYFKNIVFISPTLKSGVWTLVQLLCSKSGIIICIYNSFWILSFSDLVEYLIKILFSYILWLRIHL